MLEPRGLMPKARVARSNNNKKDIVEKLDVLLSTMSVLASNIHSAHWNLSGCVGFIFLHTYFDELYAATGGHVDKFAEYVRIQGEFPVFTMKEYIQLSIIKEVTFKETNDKDTILKKMIQDSESVIEYLKKCFEGTEDYPAINDYIAATIDDFGKRIWFLKASVSKDK